MNAQDDQEIVRGMLSMLTSHEPDPARAARTQARARAVLAARARRRPLTDRETPRGGWRPALEPLLVAGVCVVFLLEVLARATRLYGF
jgi:hypothetical protein